MKIRAASSPAAAPQGPGGGAAAVVPATPVVRMNSGAGVSAVTDTTVTVAAQQIASEDGDDLPPTITDERVVLDFQGWLAGLGFGFTLSETTKVQDGDPTREIVRVAGLDGSNLEYNIHRVPIGGGRYIEIQGPGASAEGRRFHIRLLGVALTGELKRPDSPNAVSWTLEVKADHKTLARTLALLGYRLGRGAVRTFLRRPLIRNVGKALGLLFEAAVPVLGAVVAAGSVTNAVRTFRSEDASTTDKLFAAADAFFDLLFIANPLAGTIGGFAVTAVDFVRHLLGRKKSPDAQANSMASPKEKNLYSRSTASA